MLCLAATAVHAAPISEEETVLPTTSCGDFFIAEVRIDGVGPFPMILDSGAGTTVVSKHVAREAGVRKRAKTVEIGALRAQGRIPLRVRSMDDLSRALGQRIEGIVGHPVFSPVIVTYDYPSREVRVRKGEIPADAPGVVPSLDRKRPFVVAEIDGHRLALLIDTGSGRGITLTDVERYAFKEPMRPTGGRMRIDGLHVVRSGRLGASMTVGPLILEAPIVNESVSIDLIGQVYLREFVVSFDQKRDRVRFERPGGPVGQSIPSPPVFDIGAVFEPGDDTATVLHVFEDSPAEAAGLQKGDVILEIDGAAYGDRGCPSSARRGAESRDVALILERKGVPMSLSIRTKALVP